MRAFAKTSSLACAVLAAAALLAGCGGGGGGGGSATNPQRPRVVFANASPDAGPLDFYLDGTVRGNAVAFRRTSGAYVVTDAQLRDVTVTPDGRTEPLIAETFTFAPDTYVAFVAYGLRNFGADNLKRLNLLEFTYDASAPNGESARFIVVNGFLRGTGLLTPGVDFRSPGDNPQVNLANIGFGQQQTVNVNAVAQDFQVRRNGTERVYVPTVRFAPRAGKVYLVLISGTEGQTGANAPRITFLELPPKDE